MGKLTPNYQRTFRESKNRQFPKTIMERSVTLHVVISGVASIPCVWLIYLNSNNLQLSRLQLVLSLFTVAYSLSPIF